MPDDEENDDIGDGEKSYCVAMKNLRKKIQMTMLMIERHCLMIKLGRFVIGTLKKHCNTMKNQFMKQLHSMQLLRILRSGADRLCYRAEEDEEFV